jgi:hypothetical protein
MRGGTVIVLLGLTAVAAFSVGRQDAPASKPSAADVSASPSQFVKPVAFTSPTVELPAPTPAAKPAASQPAPTSASNAPPARPDQITRPDTKRNVETALTAATRAQYHAGGRPSACPDDTMRNGRACGGRSAYSRPGGASPLCYPSDVTAAMIDSYRQRQASR